MPTTGHTAPDFELLNQDGQKIRLSDFRGKKVILFAFPKANTGGCNAQACSFRDELPRLQSNNAVVLGISTDSVATLKGWKESRRLGYDLLSDPDHKVLEAWGAWGKINPLLNLVIPFMATIRSYWVIDENGVVVTAEIGVNPVNNGQKALKVVEDLAASV